jgi:hypothetical protein
VAQNRFKYEGVEYTEAEIIESRLLSKNVNGAVFLTPLLRKMYPNATFFGLVRDGRALCESHLRRGASVEEVVDLYRKVGGAMLDYESTYSGFHLLKFENLVREPRGVLSKVYEKANLRFSRIRKIRLQIKEKTSSGGERHLKANKDRKVVWYNQDEVSSYFDSSINSHQIGQLDNEVRAYFEDRAKDTLSSLGYNFG